MGIQLISLQLLEKKDRRGENYRKENTSVKQKLFSIHLQPSVKNSRKEREITKLGDIPIQQNTKNTFKTCSFWVFTYK